MILMFECRRCESPSRCVLTLHGVMDADAKNRGKIVEKYRPETCLYYGNTIDPTWEEVI